MKADVDAAVRDLAEALLARRRAQRTLAEAARDDLSGMPWASGDWLAAAADKDRALVVLDEARAALDAALLAPGGGA